MQPRVDFDELLAEPGYVVGMQLVFQASKHLRSWHFNRKIVQTPYARVYVPLSFSCRSRACHAMRRVESHRYMSLFAIDCDLARDIAFVVVVDTRLMHNQHVACRPVGSIPSEQMQKDPVNAAVSVSAKMNVMLGQNSSTRLTCVKSRTILPLLSSFVVLAERSLS